MWKSLANLAKDIVKPQYEEEEEEEDETEQQQQPQRAPPTSQPGPTAQPQASVPPMQQQRTTQQTTAPTNQYRTPQQTPRQNIQTPETANRQEVATSQSSADHKVTQEYPAQQTPRQQFVPTEQRITPQRSPVPESGQQGVRSTPQASSSQVTDTMIASSPLYLNLQKEKQLLKDENAQLQESVQILQRENEEIKQQTSDYSIQVQQAHEATVAYFQQQMTEMDAKHQEELKKAISEVGVKSSREPTPSQHPSEEFSVLSSQLSALQDEKASWTQQHQALTEQLVRANKSILSVTNENEIVEKKCRELGEQLQEEEKGSQELRGEYNGLQLIQTALKKEIEELKQKYEDKEEESVQLRCRVNSLTDHNVEENSVNQKKMDVLTELNVENAQLQENLSKIQEEVEEVKSRCTILEMDREQAEFERDAVNEDFQSVIKKLIGFQRQTGLTTPESQTPLMVESSGTQSPDEGFVAQAVINTRKGASPFQDPLVKTFAPPKKESLSLSVSQRRESDGSRRLSLSSSQRERNEEAHVLVDTLLSEREALGKQIQELLAMRKAPSNERKESSDDSGKKRSGSEEKGSIVGMDAETQTEKEEEKNEQIKETKEVVEDQENPTSDKNANPEQEEKNSEIEAETQKLIQELKDSNASYAQQLQSYVDYSQQMQEYSSGLQQKLEEISMQSSKNEEENNEKIQSLEQSIALLTTERDEQNVKYQNMEKELQDKIKDGEKKHSANMESVLSEKNIAMKADIDNALREKEKEFEERLQGVTKVTEDEHAHSHLVQPLEQSIAALTTERDELQIQQQNLQQEVTNLSEKVEDMDKKHAANIEVILSEKNATAEAEISRVVDQKEKEFEEKLNEVQMAKADVETKVHQLQEQLQLISTEKNQLRNDWNASAENAIRALQTQTQLENQVSALNAHVSQLQLELSQKTQNEASDETKQKNIQQLSSTIDQLKKENQELQIEWEDAKEGREVDKSLIQHHESSISALTTTNKELHTEVNRLRDLTTKFHQSCYEMLLKSSVELPGTALSFQEVTQRILSEYQKNYNSLIDAQEVQSQWERTYEQARQVNESTGAQLQEAWSQNAEIKEDLSLKEISFNRVTQQMKEEKVRSQELQLTVSTLNTEAANLRERVHHFEHELRSVKENKSQADLEMMSTNTTVEELKLELQDKDKEANESRQALENLQGVLEHFQTQRQKDIGERTSYLLHEIDLLKAQVASCVAERNAKKDELQNLEHQRRKEIAAKSTLITSLQNKLAEMRNVMEETASKLNDEHQIDKRVVSHLLVNYVNSVETQRGDEQDIVRVMSGLLNWDDDMMQKAGLIPGPMNPKTIQSNATSKSGGGSGILGSAMSWFSGGATTTQTTPAKKPPAEEKKGSLAEMWVDFLIRESEGGEAKTQQPPQPGGGHPPNASESSGGEHVQ